MKPSFRCCLLAASLLAMPGAWAQNDLQEGLWEVTVTMAIGGQPTSAQPLVVRECIAQQNAQELMSQLTGAGTCSTADLRQEGNRASWKLTCSSPVEIEADGNASFSGDSFEGAMAGQLGMSGQRLPFSQNFHARRVGPCQ
jgi:hypothetical protein